ncbi:MAG TPA: GNAT family N-acetyltransferase, partial [Actinomycetota bacterium]
MTAVPEGYTVRPGSVDDVPQVAALEAAYDTAVLGAPYMDDAWVREDWTRERFDPAVDSWLVTAMDGALAAYGHTCDEEGDGNLEAIVRVHPDHWGRGLGSALIGLTERR